jgi:hypothetical protein
MFRVWLEYFGKVFGRITIAVPANGTSQECSNCGTDFLFERDIRLLGHLIAHIPFSRI